MAAKLKDWVGQTLAQGRYRVDSKLGEGGMGLVYQVRDRNVDSDVVIKVPRRAMLDDPDFARRFAREIRSMVKLSHPHIVKVTDVGEHEGLPFAVMQFLPGGSLDDRKRPAGKGRSVPNPPGSLAGWLPGIASALDYIHRQNYIHRDVKPANILFDAQGHPFLGDFGIAKVVGDSEPAAHRGAAMTGAGMVLGTPEYMAPELVMGGSFDGRVDQYALASAVYEMLCGRKACSGESPSATMVLQTRQLPPPMTEVSTAQGPAISGVIFKAMAKNPANRFATCLEFSEALLESVTGTAPRRTPTAVSSGPLGLSCPSCDKPIPIPGSVLANPSLVHGKPTTCPSCQTLLRFGRQGLTLSVDGTSSAEPVDLMATRAPANRSKPPWTPTELNPSAVPNRPLKPQVARTVIERAPVDRTVKVNALADPIGSIVIDGPAASTPPARPALPAVMIVTVGIGVVGLAMITLLVGYLVTRGDSSIRPEAVLAVAEPPRKSPVRPTVLPDQLKVEPVPPSLPPQKPPTDPPVSTPVSTPTPPAHLMTPLPGPSLDTTSAMPGLMANSALGTAPTPIELVKEPSTTVEPKPEPKDVVAPPNARVPGRLAKVTNISLEQLLEKPENYEGSVVIPNEMLKLDIEELNRSRSDANSSIACQHSDNAKARANGSPLTLVVDAPVAEILRSKILEDRIHKITYAGSLQIKVEREPGRKDRYRGMIQVIELFLKMDEAAIARDAIGRAFLTGSVSADGYWVGTADQSGPGKGERWQGLIGHPFLLKVKLHWKKEDTMKRNILFDKMGNVVAKDALAASQILLKQQQDMINNVWKINR